MKLFLVEANQEDARTMARLGLTVPSEDVDQTRSGLNDWVAGELPRLNEETGIPGWNALGPGTEAFRHPHV